MAKIDADEVDGNGASCGGSSTDGYGENRNSEQQREGEGESKQRK